MSATQDTTTNWQDQILRLKAEDPSRTSQAIADMVGKHAGTVRKVLARNPLPDVDASSIPGQTTVDDHLADVPPEDDPEHTSDPLDDFRAEAGVAVGPMPPDPNPPEPEGYEVRLAGTRQMALDFGPLADTPVGGTLVIKSDKLASGFYGLGDVISGTFTARIVDVAGKERLQRASEEFRAQPQSHVALITELSVAVEDLG